MSQVVARELVLENFKSFGVKTRIPLKSGFTTISGPNGSGKSNLLDALLFVLGLSSSKQLRAERLPDLITNQKGKTFARVGLKLSVSDPEHNTERLLEVARKVKLTKAGYVSTYYIDGTPLPLTKVHDLLNEIGIGSQGGNVVLQGDVTRIITMSANDRRKLIDELAGVAEFDRKIEQAEGELGKAERHMEDCRLISGELDERLAGLAEEREQALKHQELESQRDLGERQLLFAEARELDRKAEGFRNDAQDLIDQCQQAKDDLPKIGERIDKARAKLNEAEENLRRMGEGEKLEKLRELEELKAKTSSQRAEIHHAEGLLREGQRRARSLTQAIDRAKEERDEHQKRADAAGKEAEVAEKDEAEARKQIAQCREQLEQVASESRQKVDQLHDLKDQRREVQVELEGARVKAENAREQKARAEKKVGQLDEALLALAGKLKGLHELVDDADETRKDLHRRADDSVELVRALKSRRQELQDRKADLEDEIRPLIRQIGAAEASKQLDTQGRALQMLRSAGIPGVIGDVGSLVDFPAELGAAIQAAGGGRLRNIIVEDDKVAARCIDHLRSNKGPRTTFLPLNKIRGQAVTDFLSGTGLDDYLINKVTFDEAYLPAFEYVFGRTVLAEDMGGARRYLGKYRMVTPEGDLLETSGAMSGGGNLKARAAAGGNLAKLRGVLQAKEAEARRTIDELNKVERRIHEAEEARDRARVALGNLDRDLARDKTDREALLDQRVALKKQRDELAAELAEAQKVLEDAAGVEGRVGGSVESLGARIDALTAELEGGEAHQLSEQVEELGHKAEELKGKARELTEEVRRKELEASYLVRSIEGWEKELEEVLAREVDLKDTVAERRKEAARLEEAVAALSEELEGLSSELEALRQEREKCSKKLEALFGRRAQVEARITVLTGQVEAAELKVSELMEVKVDFERQLEERGGLPEGSGEVPSLTKVRRDVERVAAALRELGPVNLLAVQQYQELEERRLELTDRLEVLQKESDDLRARIERFGDLKKEAFLKAFHEVDKNFREIYGELSEGAGHLDLEKPDDPFAGGMTLKAQPRHKPMERLEALSGGEKSLAALAFIFSMQGVRPAPFYVFDEVDMFLDGRNTERLADMIKRRASGTQFLVVSLRKAMLTRSVRTIGVTPGPGGNTKVTGIEYPERAEAEAEKAANA